MKTVHIHVGPHKTGTTSIQEMMRSKKVSVPDVEFLESPATRRLARLFSSGDYEAASGPLSKVVAAIRESAAENIVICEEDFAGALPGRGQDFRLYPNIVYNITALKSAFSDFRCVFYFTVRDWHAWARSAYKQYQKHGLELTNFQQYVDAVAVSDPWVSIVEQLKGALGKNFRQVAYSEDSTFDVRADFLKVICGREIELPKAPRVNSSISSDLLRLLELINQTGSSSFAKGRAKDVLAGRCRSKMTMELEQTPPWPPIFGKDFVVGPSLSALAERTRQRVRMQKQENLLPPSDIDLCSLQFAFMDADTKRPNTNRRNIVNQAHLLMHSFRGQPEICYLLALTISYLRRDTEHTGEARVLFHRLWKEHGEFLLALLSSRWLISCLQTFLDHGENENQRLIGAAGFFYANMVKIYEGERLIEGRAPHEVYKRTSPSKRTGFSGLDRFSVGETDLLLNTNVMALELASRDAIVGSILQEFLIRTQSAQTVFSRMDLSKEAHGRMVSPFENCWSFFEPPTEQ
ncbi:hypothetical protein GALL_438240 [mine drainage metagenome]|uniref:Sulfotransferase family protein n=1 Tax=mine drainage metagenome TaxID=410659 RepID=A0A1J5PTQ7_9ZZZZ